MSKRSVIPFGPQHPVLPEPIHLDLVMEDEKVVEAIPSIGFIHRGLEKLVDKKDFVEMVYVAERICGICSLGHGLGYSEAVEHVMDIEVPSRAKYIRTILSEMSRIHSHILWLGLLADGFGFESLYMESWRLREQVLDMFEEATGGRVIFSIMKIGGIRRDIPNEMLADFQKRFDKMEEELKSLSKPFLDDIAVQSRLRDVGFLTAQQAEDLGCCGPFLRASGVKRDIRSTGYEAYGELDFEPCQHVRKAGTDQLIATLDAINQRFGKGTLGFAGTALTSTRRDWGTRQERRSPNYTTCWDDMPIVRA